MKGGPALLIGFGEGKPGMGKPEAEEPGMEEESSGSLAGTALAKALKSGNGQAIFDAFAALQRECDDAHGEEEEESEPVAEGASFP